MSYISNNVKCLFYILLKSEYILVELTLYTAIFYCIDMDPENGAQDVSRCDLCKTNIVQSYCDFCHFNLCKPCIGEHIYDEYDNHRIVPFQQRNLALIYPKCQIHNNETCELLCQNCNISVCSFCMVSQRHREHDFSALLEVYETKKESIKNDIDQLKKIISPFENYITDFENQIANMDARYEKLTNELLEQKHELHREIEFVFNQMKEEVSEIKSTHLQILRSYCDDIKQKQSLFQQTSENLKKLEETNELNPTIEYQCKNKDFFEVPPMIKVSMSTFIPKPIDREKLCSLIGEIIPFCRAMIYKGSLSPEKPNSSGKKLLNEFKLVEKLKTRHVRLRRVSNVEKGKIATSGDTNNIYSYTIDGILLNSIETKSGKLPNDICLDCEENLIYSDGETKTVYKVTNEKTKELIKLQGWVPTNLCVSYSGDLLISMFSDDKTQCRVVRYSESKEKQIIQFDGKDLPLYSANGKVKYIAENRNQDICVTDSTDEKVVVVNYAGKLRFRYTGCINVSKKKTFRPFGITTDSQSRILIADDSNCFVHILDENGQFLRFIDNCDLQYPLSLCVDKEDNLFVCEYLTGDLKKIKFSE